MVGWDRAWGRVWVGRVVGLVQSSLDRMVAWQCHTAQEHCSHDHGPDGCSLGRPTGPSCMHGNMHQQQARSSHHAPPHMLLITPTPLPERQCLSPCCNEVPVHTSPAGAQRMLCPAWVVLGMGMTVSMHNGNCLCPENVTLLKNDKPQLEHAGRPHQEFLTIQ